MESQELQYSHTMVEFHLYRLLIHSRELNPSTLLAVSNGSRTSDKCIFVMNIHSEPHLPERKKRHAGLDVYKSPTVQDAA